MPKQGKHIMKLSKIILLCIFAVVMTIDLNASRIKKDLLSSKEDEIVVLLKEKIAILDKLIIEAKIYKNEKDPLITKDFFGTPNAFVTKFNYRRKNILTSTDNSAKPTTKTVNGRKILPSSNKIGTSRAFKKHQERDIFGIKMKKKDDIKISFLNNIHFAYILEDEINKYTNNYKYGEYRKDSMKISDKTYSEKFESVTNEILQKYSELISLLSLNDISKGLDNMVKRSSIKVWSIQTELSVFKHHIKEDQFFKKKTYDLSIELYDTFEKLHNKKEIKLSNIPSYYDEKIDKDLKCVESSKPIKYKGRICINPIYVDQDKYFKYGTFETKENNFLQLNGEYFKSLLTIDKKLKIASQDYIKFIVIKVSSPTKKNKIDLSGGL